MRYLLLLCCCFSLANSNALAQQTDPNGSLAPAPLPQAPATPPAIPLSDPEASYNFDDPEPPAPDDLDLDSNQSFDFDESDEDQFASTADTQSSIASNSNFRGASPQMIGDFGGGSTILSFGGIQPAPPSISPLSTPIPLAGGSRRIKFAENNQVQPLNRVYGTFNYFHNAIVAGGPGAEEQSKSVSQGAFGIEKTFFDDYISLDLRMPFTGGVDQVASNLPTTNANGSEIRVDSGGAGNLSTGIKAYLLQMGQTSVSGGLSISIPTGSDVDVLVSETFFDPLDGSLMRFPSDRIEIDNNAVHLMPFLGVYRPFGDSWWLQAFTQVDTPTSGNDVRVNGQFFGRLTEQTLLYTDISLGKWLYRKPSNQCDGCDGCDGCDAYGGCSRRGGCGVTGVASILELHYTSSLNDADRLLQIGTAPGAENRFDVLNLTAGLQVEISERWRINVAGAFPLRDGRFDESGSRQEDRFFDSEFSLQINRFF